ncbi:hypothetical protein ACSS6W_008802 [Trichoderma asperelloides]
MSTPRRHRSAFACQNCRRRKVRCSVSVTGIPCVGCTQDNIDCIVHQTQDLKRQQPKERFGHHDSFRRPVELELGHPASDSRRALQSLSPASVEHGLSTATSYTSLSDGSKRAGKARSSRSGTEIRGNQDEQRTGTEISSAALGQNNQAAIAPFYTGIAIMPQPYQITMLMLEIGEAPGFTSILDACSPSQQPAARHILISEAPISLSDEDREYLRCKGVFTLPQKSTCDELLRAYFHHVHPIMPVVDASVLLKLHQTGKASEWNLLILWSMFFVAANFVDAHVWTLEGYSSRNEMKAAMYSRAKCMYDNGGETDKVVLLQSALLMAFWHSKWDGHSQPWYWTGVAISLAQILGLHRDPDSVKFNTSIPSHRRHLWRRLWWSCFFRDRSLSLTLGRPMRINLSDCNMPMASAADVVSDLSQIPPSVAKAYIPDDLPQLAEYWVLLIQLNKLLDALSRRLSLNKLELCMMVMEELEEMYTSASLYRGVFSEAICQLYPNYSASSTMSEQNSTDYCQPRASFSNDAMMVPLINDDILNALFDESSCFTFWESFSDIQMEPMQPGL